MVLRMWKTRSTAKQAVAYIELATKKVFPKVRAIEGHRGEYLLRREMEDGVELVVLTLWDSMEAVRRFEGTGAEQGGRGTRSASRPDELR